MIEDVRKAVVLTWLVVSGIFLVVLVTPYVLSEETILYGSGLLRDPAHGAEACVLCGITRAFLAISRGDFQQALMFNKASIAIYAALAVNVVIAFLYLGIDLRRLFSSGSFNPILIGRN